ncbi:AraC family transcriptional regulator (plasmid) [Rhizobium sp. WL3]|nr:AraC family transcriptional regulator [Rhizobium sp. WL3]
MRYAPRQPGIERIEAFFSGEAYAPHRHDTYSIGYTIDGVQSFDYRGARVNSTPGRAIVLHPDEVHNGEAGTEQGFHYRMLYIEPSLIREALCRPNSALPFVRDAVLEDPRLFEIVYSALSEMDAVMEPIAIDGITAHLTDSLLVNDASAIGSAGNLIDIRAVRLAREYLNANICRTVSSRELELVTGQDRYELARQFRKAYSTSPYRYLTMRRLDKVRFDIARGLTLADAAVNAGFSDQAHMTRRFKANFGLSPGSWQRLVRSSA